MLLSKKIFKNYRTATGFTVQYLIKCSRINEKYEANRCLKTAAARGQSFSGFSYIDRTLPTQLQT